MKPGHEAYSYHFVYKAFALLGALANVERSTARKAARFRSGTREAGTAALPPELAPLHMTYLTPTPGGGVPFWEFPDLPNLNLENNPRITGCISRALAILMTACRFARRVHQIGRGRRSRSFLCHQDDISRSATGTRPARRFGGRSTFSSSRPRGCAQPWRQERPHTSLRASVTANALPLSARRDFRSLDESGFGWPTLTGRAP